MASLVRAAVVVVPTLMVAAISLGSSQMISDSSQDTQPAAEQATKSLLELLEEPQAEATPTTGKTPPPSADARVSAPMVPDVPPQGESVNLPIRVALMSRLPINSLQTSPGMVCRVNSTGPRIKDQALLAMLQGERRGFVRCKGGTILINQVPYRHNIDFLLRDQGWMAVNELDLEQYVASVVGAEMPSGWNLEALKAQAVAARSYALAHLARPASRDFHLGDTTRWQVYGGDRSRSTLWHGIGNRTTFAFGERRHSFQFQTERRLL